MSSCVLCFCFFKQKTAYEMRISDWSSDVCSSDLGVYAFYFSGPWNIGEFRQRLPASQQDEWATAPLPGPRAPGAGIASGSSLVIFRHSPRKAQTWLLIEY